MHTVKAPSVILQACPLSRLLSSDDDKSIGSGCMMLWCSAISSCYSYYLKPSWGAKTQSTTKNLSKPCILFIFLFLEMWGRPSVHCECVSILVWVYLMHTITDFRTPLFKVLLFSTKDMHVITSPGWLTPRTTFP